MKIDKVKNTDVIEFGSVNEFYKYCIETPVNKAFMNEDLASNKTGLKALDFSGTNTFEEAGNLLVNGWETMAKKLNTRVKVLAKDTQVKMKQKNHMSVAGYQAIVPLYLSNQPCSMLSKKNVPSKQKVVTINKMINYPYFVDKDEIFEESAKALQIVNTIEATGVRVNLNVIFVVYDKSSGKVIFLKVRIKSSSERLNISKVSFPLVHPSMLRRMCLRFLEVYPDTPNAMTSGYGQPIGLMEAKKYASKEYFIPTIFRKNLSEIKSLNDL